MVHVIIQALKILTISAMAILVAAGGLRVFSFAIKEARPEDTGQRVTITIGENETAGEVADKLVAADLIRSKLLFQGQLRLSGVVLQAGEYTLRKGMSSQQIIDRISGVEIAAVEEEVEAAADDGGPETFDIVIPEGWRITQIAEEYAALGGEGGFEAFMTAVDEVDRSQFDFLAGLPPDASLEGFLFPDTYTVDAGNPGLLVRTMLTNFGEKYTPEMRARTDAMQITLRDVLILASLVEKEAQLPEERPIVADVYLSRWEQGWRLDADPTVQYALGRAGDWWPQLSGDDLFADSPYNTYQVDGLPPGPICNPGYASIQAVLQPADTPYMYFVAKGDGSGEHAFAETYEEQQANVAQFQGGSD